MKKYILIAFILFNQKVLLSQLYNVGWSYDKFENQLINEHINAGYDTFLIYTPIFPLYDIRVRGEELKKILIYRKDGSFYNKIYVKDSLVKTNEIRDFKFFEGNKYTGKKLDEYMEPSLYSVTPNINWVINKRVYNIFIVGNEVHIKEGVYSKTRKLKRLIKQLNKTITSL